MSSLKTPVGGTLSLSIIGALIGAAGGTAAWLALEHYAGYAFDPAYFALIPGFLAGLLAVLFGKRPAGASTAVPAITLVFILAGGYLSCWNAATMARAESETIAAETVTGFAELSDEQKREAVDRVHVERVDRVALSPMTRLISTWGLWYLLFGFLAVWGAHFIVTGGNDDTIT